MNDIKSIIDSNFPFEKYRTHQYDVITDMVEKLKDSQNYILEAPTATGKSVIAYTAAKSVLDNNYSECLVDDCPEVIICTLTKQLQKQYIDSFKNQDDTSYIYSGRNYPCALYPELNGTDDACYYGHPLCPGAMKCQNINSCKYQIQKKKFLKHRIGIVNYHYFLKSQKLKTNILILDECHELENLLADEVTITLSSLSLIQFSNTLLKIKGIKHIDAQSFLSDLSYMVDQKTLEIADIEDYIHKFNHMFEPIIEKIDKQLQLIDKKSKKYIKNSILLTKLKEIIKKYNIFLLSETDWVISEKSKNQNNSKIIVKPLDIYEFFQQQLQSKTDKIIFMSATVCGADGYASNLGIPEYDYLEVPATIPINHRQVYLLSNIGNLNYRNRNTILPKFIKAIDKIIEYHRKCDNKVNGIIHSVSYKNAEYIKEHSKYTKNIIIPTAKQKDNIDETLKGGQKILVSPSIMTGIDLYDDRSRFQILLKVPYLNLSDNWIKHKLEQSQVWYIRHAIISIIQCSGRSIRSVDDFANTYILDSNFYKLINQHRYLFPKYYLDSIISTQL